MEIVAASERAPAELRGASVALGNFDGVHRGHAAVVAGANAARGPVAPLAAAVFEPHPRVLFQPDSPPFRLQSPAQRARALAGLGVKAVFEIGFDRDLASLSDEAFARDVLAERLGAAHVAVGADFRFGRGRMGDVHSLARYGAAFGFGVTGLAPVGRDGTARISSSAIRQALQAGHPEVAADWLGRPFAIEGVVAPGFQRGRTIGFPTANLGLGAYVRPAFGVYSVWANLGDGVARPAVANLGVKPTVGGAVEPLLETHLFDFAGDLYGRRLEVALIGFLRAERKFESFDALKAQIAHDAAAARALLSK